MRKLLYIHAKSPSKPDLKLQCFWRCCTTWRVCKLGRRSNFPLGSRDWTCLTCGT